MPTTIDYTLLGRVPSPYDERDYQLENYLDSTDPLDRLLAEAQTRPLADIKQRADLLIKDMHETVVPLLKSLTTFTPPSPGSPTSLWANTQPILDQGDTLYGVGFAWAQWANTAPCSMEYEWWDGVVINSGIQELDGDSVGLGSSIRSGARVMKSKGLLAKYAFTKTLDTALEWVRYKGPLVVGSDWTESMFTPDGAGLVVPSGSVIGGHSYVMVGYDGSDLVQFTNIWGDPWGLDGHFFMHKADFEPLLVDTGEFCTSVSQ
jgi:hypothetical protein